jgi:uncharacterized membrane protein
MTSNRWLIIALAASLAINVGFIGFLAGKASSAGLRPPIVDPMFNMGAVVRRLPAERREQLSQPIRRYFRSMRGNVGNMREHQEQLNAVLRAGEFDRFALREALDAFSNSLCTSMAGSHEPFVELTALLTPEERALLTRGIGGPPGRGPGAAAGPRRPPRQSHDTPRIESDRQQEP